MWIKVLDKRAYEYGATVDDNSADTVKNAACD